MRGISNVNKDTEFYGIYVVVRDLLVDGGFEEVSEDEDRIHSWTVDVSLK